MVGLPSNPASALITLVLLVRPYLPYRLDVVQVAPLRVEVPAGFAWTKTRQRREYLRNRLEQDRAVLYPSRSSGILHNVPWVEGPVEVYEGHTLVEGEGVISIPLSELLDRAGSGRTVVVLTVPPAPSTVASTHRTSARSSP